MTDQLNARQWLRAATAEDHGRVDAAFGEFDLATRAGYSAFLCAQADACVPVEAGIDGAAFSPLHDWPARRRAHLLLADLRALGLDAPRSFEVPVFDSAESVLGAIYVLEGSRLGARVLARRVPAGLPQHFIRAEQGAPWPTLIDVLDATLVAEAQLAAAARAAHAVFARFAASARRHRQDETA